MKYTELGYPCHKYIMRSLNVDDTTQVLTFAKSYYLLRKAEGLSQSDVLDELDALSEYCVGVGNERPDFLKGNGLTYSRDTLLHSLEIDDSIASLSCMEYAYSYLKKELPCENCPHNRLECQKLRKTQERVLATLLCEKQDYQIVFREMVSEPAAFFNARYEAAVIFSMPLKKPGMIYGLQPFYEAYEKKGDGYYSFMNDGTVECIMSKVRSLYKTIRNLPSEIKALTDYGGILSNYFQPIVTSDAYTSVPEFKEAINFVLSYPAWVLPEELLTSKKNFSSKNKKPARRDDCDSILEADILDLMNDALMMSNDTIASTIPDITDITSDTDDNTASDAELDTLALGDVADMDSPEMFDDIGINVLGAQDESGTGTDSASGETPAVTETVGADADEQDTQLSQSKTLQCDEHNADSADINSDDAPATAADTGETDISVCTELVDTEDTKPAIAATVVSSMSDLPDLDEYPDDEESEPSLEAKPAASTTTPTKKYTPPTYSGPSVSICNMQNEPLNLTRLQGDISVYDLNSEVTRMRHEYAASASARGVQTENLNRRQLFWNYQLSSLEGLSPLKEQNLTSVLHNLSMDSVVFMDIVSYKGKAGVVMHSYCRDRCYYYFFDSAAVTNSLREYLQGYVVTCMSIFSLSALLFKHNIVCRDMLSLQYFCNMLTHRLCSPLDVFNTQIGGIANDDIKTVISSYSKCYEAMINCVHLRDLYPDMERHVKHMAVYRSTLSHSYNDYKDTDYSLAVDGYGVMKWTGYIPQLSRENSCLAVITFSGLTEVDSFMDEFLMALERADIFSQYDFYPLAVQNTSIVFRMNHLDITHVMSVVEMNVLILLKKAKYSKVTFKSVPLKISAS